MALQFFRPPGTSVLGDLANAGFCCLKPEHFETVAIYKEG